MPEMHFLVPGDPDTATGGYLYDGRICRGLASLGWRVRRQSLSGAFPFPRHRDLDEARTRLGVVPTGQTVVIDGLALGAMPAVISAHGRRLRIVALVHHPLALETGLDEATRESLRASEREALAHCRAVVVTSRFSARLLATEYGVPEPRLHVIEPGTDHRRLARGSADGTPRLLCVATLTPRKGHVLLVDALASLDGLGWTLDCAGSLNRSPATVKAVRRAIEGHGLEGRIVLRGALEPAALDSLYCSADMFVLASHFEGYGMACAEALAHGLPVIGTRAGAVAELVPPDAGVLVAPGDGVALRQALESVLTDPELRGRLAAGARRARTALPDWDAAAGNFACMLQGVSGDEGVPGG